MRYCWLVVGNASTRGKIMKLVLLLAIVLGLLFSPVGIAHATDNTVDVAVCSNDGRGSAITITKPLNSSVVKQPTTTFMGNVRNATQIKIEIDGAYVSTVSIGSDQATFATDIALTEGTHTIKFFANDVCQNSNGSDTVAITYTPDNSVISDGLTPTGLDGGVTIGSDGVARSEDATPFQIQHLPAIGPLYKAVTDLAILVGLDATFKAGASNVLVGGTRVALSTTALTLLIIPSIFFPLVARYAPPKVSTLVKAEIRRERHYLDRIFRGIGGVLLILIYLS